MTNLRARGYGLLMFGNDASREAYEREVERRRAQMTTPYEVAPRQRVKLPGGRSLAAGDEITVADLVGVSAAARAEFSPDMVRMEGKHLGLLEDLLCSSGTPERLLEKLVEHGFVLSAR